MQSTTAIYFVLIFGLVYLVRRYVDFRQAVKAVDDHTGFRSLLWAGPFLESVFPYIPGVMAPGRNALFSNKHSVYAKAGWDFMTSVSLFPMRTTLHVADAATIATITSSRARFPKPVYIYQMLDHFGHNIIASEGDEWKRYRRIAAPAFSDRNNKLVWDEAVNIMMDMFGTVWKDKDVIEVDHALNLTLPIALFVIGVAGFGRRIFWEYDEVVPNGHQMTFKDALNLVSVNAITKMFMPNWAMSVTPSLRKIRQAFVDLEIYMREMIEERTSNTSDQKKYDRYDLFSSLLDANQEEDAGQIKLSESELMGNIFIFLLAGHETTANTLCFTFALLALYPEQQELLYQHIKQVLPDGRIPEYEDMTLLTHSMAVLYETLRMFPPVTAIPKVTAEDMVLTASNANGETKAVPIPQGTMVIMDVPGVHYNPRYWKDPHTFNPTRFLKSSGSDWSRDAFLPFSAGSRSCIGRKFFETESICILTMLVSRYTIHIMDEPQFANETFAQKYARVLRTSPGITLNPVRVPLVFKRR